MDLSGLIFNATGIGRGFLSSSVPILSASIAQRMSWASDRETTRPEDMAYSLLGLFSINMPLLYGEGQRAFIRLQEEILKISNDETLFAWSDKHAYSSKRYGLLATHPRMFRESGLMVSTTGGGNTYSMTNKGILLHTRLQDEARRTFRSHIYLTSVICSTAIFNCADLRWQRGVPRFMEIFLQSLGNGIGYARVAAHTLTSRPESYIGEESTVYVRQPVDALSTEEIIKMQQSAVLQDLPSLPLLWSRAIGNDGVETVALAGSIFSAPKAHARVACAMLFQHISESKYILVIIGSNFPINLRLGEVRQRVTDIDPQDLAFDAHVVDDEFDASLHAAAALYTPHSIGTELFLDVNVAICVDIAWYSSTASQFDPTTYPIAVAIRTLSERSHCPLNGLKWHHRPNCPAEKRQEMPL
jgi:hypothetical protein